MTALEKIKQKLGYESVNFRYVESDQSIMFYSDDDVKPYVIPKSSLSYLNMSPQLDYHIDYLIVFLRMYFREY